MVSKKKAKTKNGVRFDSKHIRLRTGESEKGNGTYVYRWTDKVGKRHAVYAPTLADLREQEEQIIVIPGTLTAEELSEKIKAGYVIVIMKLSQCVEAVHACIRLHPEANFHYFENVGTGKEFHTADRKQILEKTFPYFSLMIIQ